MRKDKGYQKDLRHYSYRTRRPANSYASGENKSLEQYLADIDKKFDARIANAKKSYARIATKTTLTGKALRDYCREWMLWEVKFDNESNLIPLEDVHIEAVCIVRTTSALLDGTVEIAVTTESETRPCRYNRMESVHCIKMCT